VVLLIADNVVAVVIVDTISVADEALSPVSIEIGEELLLTGQLATEGNNWLGNNESASIFFRARLNCWRVILNELY
jgi:hypothetical protein